MFVETEEGDFVNTDHIVKIVQARGYRWIAVGIDGHTHNLIKSFHPGDVSGAIVPSIPGVNSIRVWFEEENAEGRAIVDVVPIVAWSITSTWSKPIPADPIEEPVAIEFPNGDILHMSEEQIFPSRDAFVDFTRRAWRDHYAKKMAKVAS